MNEYKDNCKLCTPVMYGTEKPTHIKFGDNFNDAFVGVFQMGYVIHGKNHSRDKLKDEEKHRNAARIIPNIILMNGYDLACNKAFYAFYVIAFFNPTLKPLAAQP